MTTDLKPEWSPDEPFYKGCLDHTASALKGARALLDAPWRRGAQLQGR